MGTFHYSYVLEVGSYTPRSPKTIDAENPLEAANIAKQRYQDSPFSIVLGDPPLRGKTIILTYSENNQFIGCTFDFDTLEQIN